MMKIKIFSMQRNCRTISCTEKCKSFLVRRNRSFSCTGNQDSLVQKTRGFPA